MYNLMYSSSRAERHSQAHWLPGGYQGLNCKSLSFHMSKMTELCITGIVSSGPQLPVLSPGLSVYVILPKTIFSLTWPTELKMISPGKQRGWRPTMRPCQHRLPFAAFPSGLGQPLQQEGSRGLSCHRIRKCNRWSTDVPAVSCGTVMCAGSRQQQTWHQAAVEAHKIPVSCYTMMPGLRLCSSVLHFVTQPLFWSESQQAHIWEAVPLKGSMKGSEMKRPLLKAGLGELPGATGSPNLPLCFSLTCQHPFLSPTLASLSSLKPHPVGELPLQHKHSGEDTKGV